MNTNDKIYIVIGETEDVGQTKIGGPFESTFSKEIIRVYRSKNDAEVFIDSNRLASPVRKTYSGIKRYKTGHSGMEIEEHYIE